MRTFGLIGYPLSHSFSKKYFTDKFHSLHLDDCAYHAFEINSIELLPDLIRRNPELIGLNVTRPYKESVMAFLHSTDEIAASTRAVNTIRILRDANETRLSGFNTDAYGFETSVTPYLKNSHRKALILGTGASSRTVAYVFNKLGIEYAFVSRSGLPSSFSYTDLHARLSEYQVVVNTTPVGTWPDTNAFPGIPYDALTPDHLLFDLVYNPEESQFLKKGKARGAATLNGFEMLKLQAEKSWEIWNPLY
jgi:shikimate dehydrogenase